MKRRFLFAVSVLALSAGSQQLLAAEAETPAPPEKAAPAAERPAPAEERRAPARERRAQPVQQRAAQPQRPTQPSQASWTGSQAGGFGGGNAGGGGASDPFGVCAHGVSTGGPCPQSTFNFGQGGKTPGTGGVSFAYNIPLGNQFVIGLEGNVAGGKVTGSSSQSNVHSTASVDGAGFMTSELFQSTLSEGSNATVRVRFGVPIMNSTALLYGAAGVAVGKVGGSYSYMGSNFGPVPSGVQCPAFTACATNVFGAANFDTTRAGFSGGGGIELMTGIPGITIDIAYKYTTFGSFSEDVPLIVTNCFANGGCSNGTAHIDLNHVSFQSVTAGINYHTNQNNAPGPGEQTLAALAVAAGAVAAGTLPSVVPTDQGSFPVAGNQPLPIQLVGSRSFTGGFFFGYNKRFGKTWIVGAETDFAWKRLNASTNGVIFTSDDFANTFQTQVVSGQVGQKWDASVRARLGAFITPSIMTYVTAGVAFGNVNGSYNYSGVANTCINIAPCTPANLPLGSGSVTLTTTGADSWSFTRVGWTAGTGLELPVGGGWKMLLEYRFTDLGSFQRTVPLTTTCTAINARCAFDIALTVPPANVAPVHQEASFQSIRVGLAYSFNGFDGFDLGGFLGYSGGD
jgi:opacity protein-like surface antigen